ncbi:hypothetical protein V1478_000159 [Vespula squamosa]|uniref:Uncharacterized protein n=1 Tax=Vespula squamosa TaxID=30214 RepID=A0ABD2C8V9_VESSQ
MEKIIKRRCHSTILVPYILLVRRSQTDCSSGLDLLQTKTAYESDSISSKKPFSSLLVASSLLTGRYEVYEKYGGASMPLEWNCGRSLGLTLEIAKKIATIMMFCENTNT